jgi:hypothetical protein
VRTMAIHAGTALIGAALAAGCAAESPDEDSDEPVGTVTQALSGESYASWGGTMNSAGNGYVGGAADHIQIGVNINDGWTCMLTGMTGNLSGTDNPGVNVFADGGGNWTLMAHAMPNTKVDAAAVCFPAFQPWQTEPIPVGTGTTSLGSQHICGFQSVTDVAGSNTALTVSDHGSNPNVSPLAFGTWTATNNNVDSFFAGCEAPAYTGYWIWNVIGSSSGPGTITETMPAGTSCFLTSFHGNLELSSFTNGAWGSVNFSTHVWTFTAGANVNAWWLCLD